MLYIFQKCDVIRETTGIKVIDLAIFNNDTVVFVAAKSRTGGLASGLPATEVFLDFSKIIQFYVHLKSISISQLIKGKSSNFQKFLKYFKGTTTSVVNLLL